MKKILFVLCLGLVSVGYGQCISGDCENGQGTYIKSNGKYVGEFKHAYPNGQGTYDVSNGDKYVGEWKDGKYHGQGTYTTADGGKYVGEFKDNKKHGQGTYTTTAGNKYVGELKYGKKDGQGTYTWADGDKYVGEYKDGKYHGQGTLTFANGDKYVGEYKDGKKHGQGTKTYSDGENLVGEWKDGKYHGQGTYKNMILKLIFSILFVNIFGIILDKDQGERFAVLYKPYVNSTKSVIMVAFFRNFFLIGLVTHGIIHVINFIAIHLFILTIYFLTDSFDSFKMMDMLLLGICCFVMWSIIIAYLHAFTSLFYSIGVTDEDVIQKARERVFRNKATLKDRLTLFILGFFGIDLFQTCFIAVLTSLLILFFNYLII